MSWIEEQNKRNKEIRKANRLILACDSEIKCKICNEPQYNYIGLSKHLLYTHGIKPKEYYDTYCKNKTEGICIICSKETKYHNLVYGYKECCSRSCAAKKMRLNIKNDKKRFDEFRQKVSVHRKKWWSGLSDTEKQTQIDNAKDKQKQMLATMTIEERRKCFGWMNRLSKEEKSKYVKTNLNKSLIKFWNNASEEDKEVIYETRRRSNCINNGYILDHSDIQDIQINYYMYRQEVDKLTKINYRKYKRYINPKNKKRSQNGYHLDHIYSVYDGFLNNIDTKIVACPSNLRIIPATENMQKHHKSDVSKERMVLLYEKKEWVSSRDIQPKK